MNTAIIATARLGQKDAQARLLNELQDPWFRLSVSLLGNAEVARDAVQETALRFLRQLPTFAGQSELKTWAIGIAINVVREMKRKQRPIPAQQPMLSPAADVESEQAEERQVIAAVLAELPERQREAIVLRFFQEMSVQQTAAAMSCAEGTVKATVHQALRALRAKLSGRKMTEMDPRHSG